MEEDEEAKYSAVREVKTEDEEKKEDGKGEDGEGGEDEVGVGLLSYVFAM